MRALKFTIIIAAAAIMISSCGKKDSLPANYFSFKGKNYAITEALVDKNIIDTAGGSITYTTKENIGTTFIITLPLFGSTESV